MEKISKILDKGLGRMSLLAAGVAGWIGGATYLLDMANVDLTMLAPLALALSVLGLVGLVLAWIGVDL